jgi:hypothetical protein
MNYVSNSKVRGRAKQTVLEAGQASYYCKTMRSMVIHSKCQTTFLQTLQKVLLEPVRLLFGDFSKLVIGQWGFMDLSVDDKSRKKKGISRSLQMCI